MIREIKITLNEDGKYMLNAGVDFVVISNNFDEIAAYIEQRKHLLAYFPTGNGVLNRGPIKRSNLK